MRLIEKVIDLSKEGLIDQAIPMLKDFTEKHPNEHEGAHRYLSLLYIRKGLNEKALETLEKGVKNNPDNLWLKLFLGDILFYDLSNEKRAVEIYEEIYSKFKSPVKSTMSPYRYVLKRLSNYYYKEKEYQKANHYYEKFFEIEPSDFYGSDFIKYSDLLIKLGEPEKALKILKIGIDTHPGEKLLFDFAAAQFPKEQFTFREKKNKGKIDHIEKITVKTKLFREGHDLIKEIDEATKRIRKPGDIITISSCVAAIAEERVIPVDIIKPSLLARCASHLVSQKSVPFGGAAPLANPYAMQVAIEEVGNFKIILAVLLGAVGKLLGKNGVFYKVAGPQSALIDDPPASIPPYDYCIIPGPTNSFGLAKKIKERTGCEAAIIDANDLGNAWAVGYTEKINKNMLEIALSDNPSGNEDQGTPIVIVRGLF